MVKDDVGFKMAEVLLSFGASPNVCRGDDPSLGAPLHMAAKRGSAALVKLFLEHGADANCKDAFGQTPLHISCRQMGFQLVFVQEQVTRALLSFGACPVTHDTLGMLPCSYVHDGAMQTLLYRAARAWATQQLASAMPCAGRQNREPMSVPWLLPEIFQSIIGCL
jgi:hypothetical protein